MITPRSLTAVVHVKFHYEEGEVKPISDHDIEVISRVLDQASGLNPELQAVLVTFADYLKMVNQKGARQSSSQNQADG